MITPISPYTEPLLRQDYVEIPICEYTPGVCIGCGNGMERNGRSYHCDRCLYLEVDLIGSGYVHSAHPDGLVYQGYMQNEGDPDNWETGPFSEVAYVAEIAEEQKQNGEDPYLQFVKAKACVAPKVGFLIELNRVNMLLKPFQALVVQWAVLGGRRMLAENFGLGKTLQQLEIIRLILECIGGGKGLIVIPLGVRQEFFRDASKIGISLRFIRSTSEIDGDGIYITNYESLRNQKLDGSLFDAVSLDEGAILRSFGGTQTFRVFMSMFANVKYRFVATATPSPNEYLELIAFADFLGIMDTGQSKTRFFQRDSVHADRLTLMPHMAKDFWLWVSSWAVMLQRPSDLGFIDDGYVLPAMDVVYHEIPVDNSEGGGNEKDGQMRMMKDATVGVSQAAKSRRETLFPRMDKVKEIIDASPNDHFVIWHEMENEREVLEKRIPSIRNVFGSQRDEVNEQTIVDFAAGEFQYLGAKPSMSGSGPNLQPFCHRAIFCGPSYKFKDVIQAFHRLQRYGQKYPVRVDLLYAESERGILDSFKKKWSQHNEMMKQMTDIIREYGLSDDARYAALSRGLGVDRAEVNGEGFTLVNNDCVLETRRMEENSVDMILTSIPFSAQYEYTPNYNDFGHSENNDTFWQQMDFLTPELLRVLRPGRESMIHVKDRVTPGGITGLGFQTVQPFHAEAIAHYVKHGFAFMGMATIATDVVRENKSTYRLGWTDVCKDGTPKGFGMSEYILQFRKPPTDTSNGYADNPVTHSKLEYSRARWQFDACGIWRSSGNRLLSGEDVDTMTFAECYRLWKSTLTDMNNIYDYEFHVKVGDNLDAHMKLPPSFSLIPVHVEGNPSVWTDITRMRTLNKAQGDKGFEKHICPLQTDIVDRCIERFTNPGELVFDPFGGIGTVPYCAVKKGRRGYSSELNTGYWLDSCFHLKLAVQDIHTPTLFDFLENEIKEEEIVPDEILGE